MAVGRFRDREARDAYLAVYDRAMRTWPAAPAAREIETRFGTTYLQSLGPSTGTPIVLLHAIAVSSPLWFAAVGALAEHHAVFALDTITDAGRSTQHTPIAGADDMAAWLDGALEAVGLERVHLVGLSYGGWLALSQARRAPGRLASVTAIDPPGALGAAQWRPMLRMVPDAVRAKFGKSDAALRRLVARLNAGTLPPEHIVDLAIAGLRSYRSKAPRPKRMSDDELRSITCPALILLCEASPVNDARRATRRATAHMPNVRAEIVAGAGHMLPVDDDVAFTSRLLAFVDAIDELDRASGGRPEA